MLLGGGRQVLDEVAESLLFIGRLTSLSMNFKVPGGSDSGLFHDTVTAFASRYWDSDKFVRIVRPAIRFFFRI
jgi:hypothetical protein